MDRRSCLAAAVMLAAFAARAGEAPANAERDLFHDGVDLSQPVRQLELELKNVVPGAGDVVIRIWCRGNKIGQVWAYEPSDPAWALLAHATNPEFYPEIFTNLKWEGDRLTGHCVIGGARSKTDEIAAGCGAKDQDGVVAIEARVQGQGISGTYTAAWVANFGGVCKSIGLSKKPATIEQVLSKTAPVKGNLTGRLLEQADIKQACPPIAATAYWPCLNGVDGSASADYGAKLVTDPSKGRIVWKSEELIPGGYYELAQPSPAYFGDIQSGHASPVLWNGRLYMTYFVGVDEPAEFYEAWVQRGGAYSYDASCKKIAECTRVPIKTWYKKSAPMADQIAVCLDAQTGQVLWRTVHEKAGPNISGYGSRQGPMGPNSKAESHLKPAVGDGRLFMASTDLTIYGLDAMTGKKLWSYTGIRKEKATGKTTGLTECPVYADGVVAMSDGANVVGLDGESGKELWQVKNACNRRAGIIRWLHKGKLYFLTARGKCIEPKTGKELWQVSSEGFHSVEFTTMAADENHLVRVGSSVERKGLVLGYRISPEKRETIWRFPFDGEVRSIQPCIYQGHAYVRARFGPSATADQTLCINLESGKLVSQAKGSKSFSSPVAGDGRIFNCDAAVTMYQKADPKDFRDLLPSGLGMVGIGRTKAVLRGVPETIGVYADGRFFNRLGDGIICYDMREPAAR